MMTSHGSQLILPVTERDHSQGPSTAPVTLVEYGDYECPVDGTVRLWAPSTDACLRVLRDDRRYERVDITGLTGVTDAQRQVLVGLGAVERSSHTPPST